MRYIPQWEVDDVWMRASTMLALAVSGQTAFNLEGLKTMLLRGDMHLWMNDSAAVITQIQTFQLERICVIVLCGGNRMTEWIDEAWKAFVKYAKSYGCSAVMIYGRCGWAKVLPDMKTIDTVMRYKL